MVVETKIIESAVKVLVASEIELAGERVAARMCAAFGKLAVAASDSTDIKVNVEKEDGCVIIRIEYESIVKAAAENFKNELPVIDDQMIYSGPEEPADPISGRFETDWEISQRQAAETAATIKDEDRLYVDSHIAAIAVESANADMYDADLYNADMCELELEPGDIQMLEDDDMSDLRMDDPDSV
jgi:hypothetical protein